MGLTILSGSPLRLGKLGLQIGGPVNPKNIPGLQSWYKADALALADGAAVASWTDSSGNGRHAVQATGTKQPLFKTNIVNGQPTVRFDGVDDNLVVAYAQVQPVTLFVVAKYLNAYIANGALIDGATANCGIFRTAAATMALYAGNSLILSNATTPQNWHLYSGIANGASSRAWLDNAFVTGNPGSANPGGITIGSTFTPSQWSNADIAEVLAYTGALSDGSVVAINRYLGWKYGIAIA